MYNAELFLTSNLEYETVFKEIIVFTSLRSMKQMPYEVFVVLPFCAVQIQSRTLQQSVSLEHR
jgi:hypothetical protein